MTPDLFEASGVKVPEGRNPMAKRAQARRLLEKVEGVLYGDAFTALERAKRLATDAEQLGAHSVARALRWWATPGTYERYDFSWIDMRLEGVTRRWLRKMEEA